jgi:cysteine desulfurase
MIFEGNGYFWSYDSHAMQQIYLDNAATTPLREEVIERMHEALNTCYGNPSSTHAFGRTAKTGIEQARKIIARELNAQPGEIIFTSGGTEADNMILRCAVRDLGVETLITSRVEHHAVLHTAECLAREYGIRLEYLPLDAAGNPDMEELEALLSSDTSKKLVSLMHVNNEIGNLLDMDALGALCRRHGALLHSDSVQSIGHFRWDVQHTAVDFLTAAAHKFHGPKGVGFAYVRKNTGLKPLIVGGAQERGFRAGTEAYHNIVGLETAFTTAYAHLEEERRYIEGLKKHFVEGLKKAIPGVVFNGLSADMERSTYTLVNVRLPFDASKSQMLLFHLDLKGIACSRGSACQSGSDAGSHVLKELLDGEALKQPSLRFSFSRYNTREELDYVIGVLEEFSKS